MWTETSRSRQPNLEPRRLSALILGHIGSEGKAAVPVLVEMMRDPVFAIHHSAADSLKALGVPAIPALLLECKSEDLRLRCRAALVLGAYRAAASDVVPALAGLLKDKEPDARLTAAIALKDLGEQAKDAVPRLIESLADEDGRVRKAAAEALGAIGPAAKEAIPALEHLKNDELNFVKLSAEAALKKIELQQPK